MHDCARLVDIESTCWEMLKLNVLKGSVQAITFFISVLSNHIKGKENKKTFVSSSTHQVDD